MTPLVLALLSGPTSAPVVNYVSFLPTLARMRETLALRKAEVAEADRRWDETMKRVDAILQRGAEVKRQAEARKAEAERRKPKDD